MKKSNPFLSGMLAMVLVFGMTLTGCATTHHGVEITNVSANNIRELNIRNAGTTSWGPNLARNWYNIDRSRFSETVDIRVVDANGFVYSQYNIPFGDAAFELTGQESQPNMVALGLLGLAILIPLIIILAPDVPETAATSFVGGF